MPRQCLPVNAESVNMMEGLNEAEEEQYFNDNPKIIPLFEVDILQTRTSYIEDKEDEVPVDERTLKEIRLQQEATKKEMQVSQRVQASTLEELNLVDANTDVEPKTILIAKEMLSVDKEELKNLLRQYKDVFAWSFEDIKGLDPAFCQHQINLHKDVKPTKSKLCG